MSHAGGMARITSGIRACLRFTPTTNSTTSITTSKPRTHSPSRILRAPSAAGPLIARLPPPARAARGWRPERRTGRDPHNLGHPGEVLPRRGRWHLPLERARPPRIGLGPRAPGPRPDRVPHEHEEARPEQEGGHAGEQV